MTSQPQVPGAPAVYLYREETTEDDLHMFSIYVRLKVLTERGKEYGTVELSYATDSDGGGTTVSDIHGRTIHPDGTVILFTGKPLQKLVEKSGNVKFMTKVFSLPDVEVGSILEYRYQLRMDDHYFRAPDWYIQSKLFTRKAHYMWKPTDKTLVDNEDGGALTNAIAWSPVLPSGVELKQTRMPPIGMNSGRLIFELNMNDIPPAPDEEYMPPIKSFTYRVLFYYTPYRNAEEFWKNKGKTWSKRTDKFIGPGPGVSLKVRQLVAAGDTQEQQLKKFYAAIMQMENTDFTRERSRSEEKSDGLHAIKNTDDILARERGSSDQLAALFVAMARAAGMKAYVGVVTNRDERMFAQVYLNMGQLDDDLAIVTIDGKERFFDPGSRYCPFGQLAWKHTLAGGIRQIDGGSALFNSPAESYKSSRIDRIADLKMDEHGEVTGIVKLTYYGAPALRCRQADLKGDDVSLNRDLKTAGERLLPGGMDVKVNSIERLTDYEQPLMVTYDVKGPIGSSTGKRLVVPAALFETNTRPEFPHEKREMAVYFEYPYTLLDAVRITFAPTVAIESLPPKEMVTMQNLARYDMTPESTPTSVTMRRSFLMGDVLFPVKDYGDLRAFYSKVENTDQESIVLTHVTANKAPAGN